MKTAEEIKITEIAEQIWPGENVYVQPTKSGGWLIYYTNDYPLQHGNGEKIVISYSLAKWMLKAASQSKEESPRWQNLETENAELRKYAYHLQTCCKMQDWTEALIAMGDTPEKFKDEDWRNAYEEMRTKMNTCTCGLDNLLAPKSEITEPQPPEEKSAY